MKQSASKKYLLLGVLLSSILFANNLSAQTSNATEVEAEPESKLEDATTDLDLFLWFAELGAKEAATLAANDPEELDADLKLAEQLYAEHKTEPSQPDTSIGEEE